MDISEMNAIFAGLKGKFLKLGWDVSGMEMKVDRQPLYRDGRPCSELEPDGCGGDWTELGFVRINPDLEPVMKRYGVENRGAGDVRRFAERIMAHELAHEIWNRQATEGDKIDVLSNAVFTGFTTPYLKTVGLDRISEETFCEYVAKKACEVEP